MSGRHWVILIIGLFIGNLIAEWIKHYFNLFGN
jgi:hypothetical protein